jgi:hypothetical protein
LPEDYKNCISHRWNILGWDLTPSVTIVEDAVDGAFVEVVEEKNAN